MKEKLPINLDVLKWARISLNLTTEDVANSMGKTILDIQKWEIGESSPTYPQLEKLAYEIYKRPVALFFFPNIPEDTNPQSDFRTLPEMVVGKLSDKIIKLYRKAKVFQINLEELYDGAPPVEKNISDFFSLDQQVSYADLARKVRMKIGIDIKDQFRWKNLDIAFNKWRDVLEKNGIFVFNDAFSDDRYSGFCLYDRKYPIIYVNNSMPTSRQIFTLFHELAHLFYRSGGVDFRISDMAETFPKHYRNIERFCNAFASEFLVPLHVLRAMDLSVDEKRISDLADQFSVSREVILRNYFNLRLIDEKTYRKLANKWINEAKEAKSGSGGNPYYTRRKYLGRKYIDLAFSKYYQHKINMETLASYLGIKVKHVSTFEHYVLN